MSFDSAQISRYHTFIPHCTILFLKGPISYGLYLFFIGLWTRGQNRPTNFFQILNYENDVQSESTRLAKVWTNHTQCGIAGKMEREMKKRGLLTFPDTRPWKESKIKK